MKGGRKGCGVVARVRPGREVVVLSENAPEVREGVSGGEKGRHPSPMKHVVLRGSLRVGGGQRGGGAVRWHSVIVGTQ